jgi:hypothetical protein
MLSRNFRACASTVRVVFAMAVAMSAACDPRRVLEPDASPQAQQGAEEIEMCIEGEADITAGAFTFSTNFGYVLSGNPNAVATLLQELEGLYAADRQAPAANFGTVAAGTKELVKLQKDYTTVRITGARLVNGHVVEFDYSYREFGYWVLLSREVVEECPGEDPDDPGVDPQGLLG